MFQSRDGNSTKTFLPPYPSAGSGTELKIQTISPWHNKDGRWFTQDEMRFQKALFAKVSMQLCLTFSKKEAELEEALQIFAKNCNFLSTGSSSHQN